MDVVTEFMRKDGLDLIGSELVDERIAQDDAARVADARQRGVLPYTALVYGLGYGVPKPYIHHEILEAAKQSLLIGREGIWLWAGGVVYADPPSHPNVMNARYIPEDQLPKGTRNFKPEKNHKTWGNRVQPLGCWRITPATRTVIALEGLFDKICP